MKRQYPDALSSYHAPWLGQLELDVFIPELKTAIEYDGVTWHTGKENDHRKNRLCTENGVRLIRIRENGLDETEDCTNVFLKANTNEALDEAIAETLSIIGYREDDINTERDTPQIVKQFDVRKKENSIAERFPELMSEWDYEKNAGIDPHYVNYGSARKFWWICPTCGNSWQMSPSNRTHLGQGCPECARTKKVETQRETLVKNRGSLEDAKLSVLEEWDYEKNIILPSQVTKSSKRKVWWKCKTCGKSWIAEIQNRTKEKGTGCPYCSGRVGR